MNVHWICLCSLNGLGGQVPQSPLPNPRLSLSFSLSLREEHGHEATLPWGPTFLGPTGELGNCTRSSSPIRLDNGWLQLTKDPFPSSKSQQFLNREGVKGNVNGKIPPSATNKWLFPTHLSWILNFPQVCLWQSTEENCLQHLLLILSSHSLTSPNLFLPYSSLSPPSELASSAFQDSNWLLKITRIDLASRHHQG